MRKLIASTFILTVIATIIPRLTHGDVSAAVTYLKSKPLSAWSIMALATANQSPSLESLKNASGTKAIDIEAPMLAMTAGGQDPRTFTGKDLVAELKGYYDGTQLGDATILNDDIFGLLALKSAGIANSDTALSGTKTYILAHQNSDGGWPYAVGGTSDTNTTAAAIMALSSCGISGSDTAITKAITYLKSAQNTDGGFPYDPASSWGTASDASSDSWVISAARSVGQDPATWTKSGKSPLDHLATLATQSGYYAYQAGSAEDAFSVNTTAYAVIALSSKYLPVATITPQPAGTVHYTYRIEGSAMNLCSGESDGITAFDAVKAAVDACGITYHVQHYAYGDYVDEISTDKAADSNGWMYLVNSASPSVGAPDYKLAAGDAVVWYFGGYQVKATRLILNATSSATGAPITGRVEVFSSGTWSPAASAAVHASDKTASCDNSGTFSLSLPDGLYRIYADGAGFVRSNSQVAAIGNNSETRLALSATLPGVSGNESSGGSGGNGGSSDNGSELSFTVTTALGNAANSLDFGTVATGTIPQKTITIKNNGKVNSYFEANVTGDEIFRSYLMLDSKTWRLFHSNLLVNATRTTDISLKVPSSYSGSGTKNGSLIFWATVVK